MALLMAWPAAATERGWALLREGGHIVLMRHAYAPGTGDPANFDITKCNTQRNLSERGRQQARKIGALFAARAEPVEHIFTSRYCRCIDTARIAFGGDAEQIEALDSIAAEPDKAVERSAAVMKLIDDYSGSGNVVLITDESNIQALTGVSPREGEAVIVVPDGDKLHVAARITFN
jgi:phosphohistidine phosphatase SixA